MTEALPTSAGTSRRDSPLCTGIIRVSARPLRPLRTPPTGFWPSPCRSLEEKVRHQRQRLGLCWGLRGPEAALTCAQRPQLRVLQVRETRLQGRGQEGGGEQVADGGEQADGCRRGARQQRGDHDGTAASFILRWQLGGAQPEVTGLRATSQCSAHWGRGEGLPLWAETLSEPLFGQ